MFRIKDHKSDKMRGFVIVVIISFFCLKSTNSKVVSGGLKEPTQSHELNEDLRGLTDIWSNIKKTANNSWNAIKHIAQNTKEKIKVWMGNVKDRALDVSKKFDDKIKTLRAKSKSILDKLVGTGQLVKECFQKESDAVEELLKQIIHFVSSCISDSMLNLAHLEEHHYRLDLNDTKFIDEIEKKINDCAKEEDTEKCLNKVRIDIYSAMESTESEILTTRTESRSIVDNVLETVMTCSVEGLIDASNAIASVTVQTINCVITN